MTRKLILLLSACFLLACGGISRSAFLTEPNPLPSPTAPQVEILPTSPTPPPPHPQPTHPVNCTVTAESLHVRGAAGVDGVVIGWLKAGQTVTILNDQPAGDWIHIQAGDLTGWINSIYCERSP